MESTLPNPAPVAATTTPMPRSKAMVIGFWIVTALFCLQMTFTAYAQLHLPQVAEAFTHLGFPAYFRVELSCALGPTQLRAARWIPRFGVWSRLSIKGCAMRITKREFLSKSSRAPAGLGLLGLCAGCWGPRRARAARPRQAPCSAT